MGIVHGNWLTGTHSGRACKQVVAAATAAARAAVALMTTADSSNL